MHGKIKHIKHGKIIQVKVNMKFINQSYEQAYTKSSNYNTCKIKQNNNKKYISISIETTKCTLDTPLYNNVRQ